MVDIYDYIANTITDVIVNLAAGWITGQGGWVSKTWFFLFSP